MTIAAGNPLYGKLLWDAIAGIVVFVALVRIVNLPATLWAHGRLSKVSWAIATIWFIPTSKGFAWPIAAVAAIWHTHKINRPTQPQVPPLPFAEGQPEGTTSSSSREQTS